ncbi:hypothetical protein Hanom_Chr00s110770g01807621 [Helianthus anomalus]
MIAENRISRISGIYCEAKRARKWDADRECYLDPYGNIAIDHNTLDIEAIIQELKIDDDYWQNKRWGTCDEKEKEEKEKKEKEEKEKKEKEEKEKKEKEEIEKSKKVDTGVIDTTQELTAENLGKMADKVLAAKALEVDSNSVSESKSQVSSNLSTNASGKKIDGNVDCKNCNKECKFCNTVTYLNGKKVDDLTAKVRNVENQIVDRDKMIKASTGRIRELTSQIENDKNDHEKVKNENEKLILENRQISEKFEKLKITMKDNDDQNGKIYKENVQLKAVLRVKEESINQQLDEIAKLKLKVQEAVIENKRIQLKLNSYSSASFVLQHIVPKPFGKNKAGEDVYSDGSG